MKLAAGSFLVLSSVHYLTRRDLAFRVSHSIVVLNIFISSSCTEFAVLFIFSCDVTRISLFSQLRDEDDSFSADFYCSYCGMKRAS